MLLYKYVVYILHGDTDVKNRGKGNRYYDCPLGAFFSEVQPPTKREGAASGIKALLGYYTFINVNRQY